MADHEQGIDLTGDGGVLKTIITEGTGTETPPSGSDVTVHYTGTLLDGTKFDSSRDRDDPFKFKLGAGQVIKGWDCSVATMKRGERCRVVLRSDYAYGKSGSPPTIPADATLVFDIELLSWKDEEDLTHDGGVLKKVLRAGQAESWEKPKDDSEVKVSYSLKTADGQFVEAKTDFTFVLGAEAVPAGLEKGVESMKKGELALIKVSGDYAKGHPTAPADAALHYEVELLDFTKEKASWEMTNEEKLAAAQKNKDDGNELFKAGKFRGAIKKYKKASSFVDNENSFTEAEKAQAKPLRITAHLNTAACNLKLKDYKACIENCDKALKLEVSNIKALFRKGQALSALDEWRDAELTLNRALEFEPQNKDVQRELQLLKRKVAEQERKDKKLYANMFKS
jgi:FK506-binding protein 4/5